MVCVKMSDLIFYRCEDIQKRRDQKVHTRPHSTSKISLPMTCRNDRSPSGCCPYLYYNKGKTNPFNCPNLGSISFHSAKLKYWSLVCIFGVQSIQLPYVQLRLCQRAVACWSWRLYHWLRLWSRSPLFSQLRWYGRNKRRKERRRYNYNAEA